jgi:hypothetical protein
VGVFKLLESTNAFGINNVPGRTGADNANNV